MNVLSNWKIHLGAVAQTWRASLLLLAGSYAIAHAESLLSYSLGAQLSSDGSFYDSRNSESFSGKSNRADFTLGIQKSDALLLVRTSLRSGYENLLFPEGFVSDSSALGVSFVAGRALTRHASTFGTDLNAGSFLGLHAVDGVLLEWRSDENSGTPFGMGFALHGATTLASETDTFEWDRAVAVQKGKGAVVSSASLWEENFSFIVAFGYEPKPLLTTIVNNLPARIAQKNSLAIFETSLAYANVGPLPKHKIGIYIGKIWDKNLRDVYLPVDNMADNGADNSVDNSADTGGEEGDEEPAELPKEIDPFKVKTLRVVGVGATLTSRQFFQYDLFTESDYAFATSGYDHSQDSLGAKVQTVSAAAGYESPVIRLSLAFSHSFASEAIYFSLKKSAVAEEPVYVDNYNRLALKVSFQLQ